MRASLIIPLALCAVLTPTAASAVEVVPARVSVLEGRLQVRDPMSRELTWLTLNAVIRSGDEVHTPIGSVAELELPGGTFVRLAGGSTLAVDLFNEMQLLALAGGAVLIRRGEAAVPVSVVAMGGRVAFDEGAVARVDVDRQRMRAEVRAVEGRVDFITAAKVDRLDAGQLLVHRPGATERSTWQGQEDAFDAWSARRDRTIASRRTPSRLAEEDYVGIYELDDNGRWVIVDGRWGWRPDVASDWRPYHDGTWSWVEPYGWVWVANTPWGYTTHHYGRWVHDAYLGWVWIPGREWGPAWVEWGTFGPYVGWAPLSPWGGAVVIGGGPYDAGCWLFADALYFWWGGGYHHHHHHGHHGGTVVVVLDQDDVNGYDPNPVDDPNDDLAPGNGSEPSASGRPVAQSAAMPSKDRVRLSNLPRLASSSNDGRSANLPRRARAEPPGHARRADIPRQRSSFDELPPGFAKRDGELPGRRVGPSARSAAARAQRPATRAGRDRPDAARPGRAIVPTPGTEQTPLPPPRGSDPVMPSRAEAAASRPARAPVGPSWPTPSASQRPVNAPPARAVLPSYVPSRSAPSRPTYVPSRSTPSRPTVTPSRSTPSRSSYTPSRSTPSRPSYTPSRSPSPSRATTPSRSTPSRSSSKASKSSSSSKRSSKSSPPPKSRSSKRGKRR